MNKVTYIIKVDDVEKEKLELDNTNLKPLGIKLKEYEKKYPKSKISFNDEDMQHINSSEANR
jgi:hypothetical protein